MLPCNMFLWYACSVFVFVGPSNMLLWRVCLMHFTIVHFCRRILTSLDLSDPKLSEKMGHLFNFLYLLWPEESQSHSQTEINRWFLIFTFFFFEEKEPLSASSNVFLFISVVLFALNTPLVLLNIDPSSMFFFLPGRPMLYRLA